MSWSLLALGAIVGNQSSPAGECLAASFMPVLSYVGWQIPSFSQVQPARPKVLGDTNPSTPSLVKKPRSLGRFKITFYWYVEEDQYSGKRNTPLYTTDHKLLGYFPAEFVKDFRIESCALLSDGRMISYLKQANRCQIVDEPLGTNGFTLMPLKSIAVDPAVIPMGSTVFIPEAVDVPIGNNTFHNGVFKAHDIGSAIKGNRIDVYLGPKSNMDFFRSSPLYGSGYVEVYVLQ